MYFAAIRIVKDKRSTTLKSPKKTYNSSVTRRSKEILATRRWYLNRCWKVSTGKKYWAATNPRIIPRIWCHRKILKVPGETFRRSLTRQLTSTPSIIRLDFRIARMSSETWILSIWKSTLICLRREFPRPLRSRKRPAIVFLWPRIHLRFDRIIGLTKTNKGR